ncbi:MAG TPA: ABC transporter substrate-binding protein [Thermomicrobiales bacterium]|nr:ABC transporter substrate-binding protein [Thermomicrobiales bacterium]
MADIRSNGSEVLKVRRLHEAVRRGRLTRREAILRGGALGLSVPSMLALHSLTGGIGASAATRQEASPEPVTGGTLRLGVQADPAELDPHKTSLTAAWHVIEHVYDTLVTTDETLAPLPGLAESWEVSDDGITYTFALRQGVLFHNDREFVADDVKYSYERILDPATASPVVDELASIDTIEVVDDYTVAIALKTPDSSFLAKLMGGSISIVPREVVEENGDLMQVMVGTGPFRFVEYVPNSVVTLERNPNFWESPLPYLDGLEIHIIPDNTARTTALVQGTVDIIEYAPVQDLPIFEDDETIEVTGSENTNIRYMGINVTREPFDQLEVRQAMAMAIDRGPIIDSAVFGAGTPTNVIFPETFWAGIPSEIPPVDIEGARALLEQVGLGDGFECAIQSWAQYPFLSNAAIVIQEQLRQIGIEAEVDLQENAVLLENYFSGNWDLSVTGTSAYVDPNDVIQSNFGTGQASNGMGYSNPDVDRLIQEGIEATDQAERAEIYAEIQRILLEELPWINLFIADQYEAMKSYVKGYVHIPTGSNRSIRSVWMDEQ